MGNKKKVLLIIPAYNEEKNIKRVVENVIENYPQYDYIVINDGSKDNTLKICEENDFNYCSLSQNLGIGGAVQTGYKYAEYHHYNIAVQIDGDGQHDPEYIKKLIDKMDNEKLDMVIGSRFIDNKGFQSSLLRRVGNKIIQKIIFVLCGCKISDATSGLRATNNHLIKLFAKEYAHDYPEPEAIVKASLEGYSIGEVPVIMKERQGGESSINGFKSVYYMIKVSLALLLCRISIRKQKGEK